MASSGWISSFGTRVAFGEFRIAGRAFALRRVVRQRIESHGLRRFAPEFALA
jgi:hypothetical protein